MAVDGIYQLNPFSFSRHEVLDQSLITAGLIEAVDHATKATSGLIEAVDHATKATS
jgi:hypothetical protein